MIQISLQPSDTQWVTSETIVSMGKLKRVPLTRRVLQKPHASKQPEDMGTMPTTGFVRTRGCSNLIGFAWVSASVLVFTKSTMLLM